MSRDTSRRTPKGGPTPAFFVADETAQSPLSPDGWPTVRGRPMTCYLVRYEYFLVFAARDPRPDGCLEPVEPGVWLDDGHLADPRTGHPPAGLCAGRSPTDDRHYPLFRSPADRSRAGFHQVVGV